MQLNSTLSEDSNSNMRKEDYKLRLSITAENRTVDSVLCEVYLPQRVADPPELLFHPTEHQSKELGHPFEFSIYGEIKDSAGKLWTVISADKVYCREFSTTQWGPDLSDALLVGDPFDLTITTISNRHSEGNENVTGSFWLTPSIMLSPVKSLTPSYTGEVTLHKTRNLMFTLFNGLTLTFDHHYRYLNKQNGEMISFPELVAEFEVSSEKADPRSFLAPIDDFLMLTSFAARQACVCLGWESYNASKVTRFFRRSIVIPDIKKQHSFNDTLIVPKDFQDFIRIAYNSFIQFDRKDLIRHAVYRAIDGGRQTLESDYLALYSALETLVLSFRLDNGTEHILDGDEWHGFKKDTKAFIKGHPLFSNPKDKDRRRLVYQKLEELNRISFADAFEQFCKRYDIDLGDLWPVVDRKDGVTLGDIRNKLVHGDTFGRARWRALISAREHLKWIVERSMLTILGWRVHDSRAAKDLLSGMRMYNEWQHSRELLSKEG